MKSKNAIEALAALAQETRLAIFRLLVRQGPDGLPAGTIGERLDIPAPTLSFHLAQLSRAGLVTSRRAGRSILYAADYRGMNGAAHLPHRGLLPGPARTLRRRRLQSRPRHRNFRFRRRPP